MIDTLGLRLDLGELHIPLLDPAPVVKIDENSNVTIDGRTAGRAFTVRHAAQQLLDLALAYRHLLDKEMAAAAKRHRENQQAQLQLGREVRDALSARLSDRNSVDLISSIPDTEMAAAAALLLNRPGVAYSHQRYLAQLEQEAAHAATEPF